jgi:hypothetical protein
MDSTNNNPPFFTATEPRTWTPNRVYRIYLAPGELVGIWAGKGNDVAMAMAAGGGLIGGLLAVATNPANKNARRRDELDSKPLTELRHDHKHNFALLIDDIDEAEIVPASFWFRINQATIPATALLRLRTKDGTRRTLALTSDNDVRVTLDYLPQLLGSRVRVEISPPVTKST